MSQLWMKILGILERHGTELLIRTGNNIYDARSLLDFSRAWTAGKHTWAYDFQGGDIAEAKKEVGDALGVLIA